MYKRQKLKNSKGLNPTTISELSGIPRATVIRKINFSGEKIEEIKVTGSYIGTRANDIGTEIIDQSDFNDLNISTIGEISKYLSSAAGAHFQSNTLDGVDQGMSAITLRDWIMHPHWFLSIREDKLSLAHHPMKAKGILM